MKLPIQVLSNPPDYKSVWYKNDTEIEPSDSIDIENDYLMFKSLSPEDNGTYGVNVTNSIGTDYFEIDLNVYCKYFSYSYHYCRAIDIFFKNQEMNETIWTEIASNDDYNLTCEIAETNPAIKYINVTTPTGSNWKSVPKSENLVEIQITKASQENRMNYTCIGFNGEISSILTYQTFVGGNYK